MFFVCFLNPTQPCGVSSYLWLDCYLFLAEWLSVLHLCFKFLCGCRRWCFFSLLAVRWTVGRCRLSQRQVVKHLRSPACRRWSTPGPRPEWRSRWWSWSSSAGTQERDTHGVSQEQMRDTLQVIVDISPKWTRYLASLALVFDGLLGVRYGSLHIIDGVFHVVLNSVNHLSLESHVSQGVTWNV